MSISTLIARMRTGQEYTQAELARRSGIPRTAINAYENGRRTPNGRTLARLADACGLELDARARPHIDLQANARALEEVLELAELLPTARRGALTFPPLPDPRP